MEQIQTGGLTRFKHRDLATLIDLYESNYLRLLRLIPDLNTLEDTVVSRVAGALDLYLSIEERFKYTTTLSLTYCFVDDERLVLEPDARICVYHDVRCAELVSHCRRKRSRTVRPWIRGRMPELDRRWDTNRFLYKWLKFCTHQGHIFLNYNSNPVASIEAGGGDGRRASMPGPGPRF